MLALTMAGAQIHPALSIPDMVLPGPQYTEIERQTSNATVLTEGVAGQVGRLILRFSDPVTKTPWTDAQFRRGDAGGVCHHMASINNMFYTLLNRAEGEVNRSVRGEMIFYKVLTSEAAEFDQISDAFCGFANEPTIPPGQPSASVLSRLNTVHKELLRAAKLKFSRYDRVPMKSIRELSEYGLNALNLIRAELVDAKGEPRSDFTSDVGYLQVSYQMGYSSTLAGLVQLKQILNGFLSGEGVDVSCQTKIEEFVTQQRGIANEFVYGALGSMSLSEGRLSESLVLENTASIRALTEIRDLCSDK